MKDRAKFKNTKKQVYVQEDNETEHKAKKKYRTLHSDADTVTMQPAG